MSVLVTGDDIVAWTKATVLASTGCQTWLSTTGHQDLSGEPGLKRMLDEESRSGRLQILRNPYSTTVPDPLSNQAIRLLIYARNTENFDQLQEDCLVFARQQAALQNSPVIIALTHPVLVGTTDRLQLTLNKALPDQVCVVYWPGFIQSGRAIESFSRPERIILGSQHNDATDYLRRLLTPFNRSKDTLIVMQPKEAELTKVAINGMLATRISFMNELAGFADAMDIDIEPVRHGIGSDSRIGFQYLYPGCGFGGQAFMNTLEQLVQNLGSGFQSGLLGSVCDINEQQKDLLFRKFWRYFDADVQGKKVAIWGCSFKPGTASIYGSPAVVLVQSLLTHGVRVSLYDPVALDSMRTHFTDQALPEGTDIEYCNSPWQAAEQADAVMLVTEWKEFWNLDLYRLAGSMNTPLLLDGRNIFNPDEAEAAGLTFSGIGRGKTL
ncbi:nucleotide sugar dehydrogenase [Oceanospirillum sediminis]|uniref:UDP-glucose 6-dehydrogenase n=1 Tax=Oceanospirillum sediminis TaxID=2760088 RepID=A0A839IM20_9GAMM|nr:nucleotide sugar dehydrogenase [Oceanospirillum sediminis]MBB1485744.1 UDP-glucose/GDP-mannose dehydrogenase family protein [Oceanospirillum sediminis]